MQKFKGPQTQIVDLGGHFVMPGFNDAHLHLDDARMTKLSVDLTGVKSLDELRARVCEESGRSPKPATGFRVRGGTKRCGR